MLRAIERGAVRNTELDNDSDQRRSMQEVAAISLLLEQDPIAALARYMLFRDVVSFQLLYLTPSLQILSGC